MTTNGSVDYDTLVRDDRVHSCVYTDQQIFADEMERVFHRGWIFVGHASEIPEPGDYRLAWVGRYPIIMVRGADGEVRLLSNRCRHRANTVCQLNAATRASSAATTTAGCIAMTVRSPPSVIPRATIARFAKPISV
jgi:Rieske [2Fe-2S] domain